MMRRRATGRMSLGDGRSFTLAVLMSVALVVPVGCADDKVAEDDLKPDRVLTAPSNPSELPVSLVMTMTLPLGASEGIPRGEASASSFETSFLGKQGLYVVDHPGSPPGARVRWFRNGQITGTYQAPAGSYAFAADGDGFMYVIAKGVIDQNGRVVLVNGSGQDTAENAIPRELHSGGLRRIGDTLYSVAWSGATDPDTIETRGNDTLVPVAIKGRQATDSEAGKNTIDGWWADGRGEVVEHVTRLRYMKDPENYVIAGATVVRIPNASTLLGVDGMRRIWILFPPRRLSARGAAGWPAATDETGLIVAFEQTGEVVGAMPVPIPPGLVLQGIPLDRRLSFDGRNLCIQSMTPAGVTMYAFEVKP